MLNISSQLSKQIKAHFPKYTYQSIYSSMRWIFAFFCSYTTLAPLEYSSPKSVTPFTSKSSPRRLFTKRRILPHFSKNRPVSLQYPHDQTYLFITLEIHVKWEEVLQDPTFSMKMDNGRNRNDYQFPNIFFDHLFEHIYPISLTILIRIAHQ